MKQCFYVTPKGKFPTLQAAGDEYKITREAARGRFSSPNFPDWISHEAKWLPKPVNKKYVIKAETNTTPRLRSRGWTMYNTENMGKHCRKGVRTPQGDFPSIALAAEHYQVSAPCMSNWLKSPTYKRPGFEFFNEVELELRESLKNNIDLECPK